MMVWDIGMLLAHCEDPAKTLEEGRFEFVLLGERMQGKWVLTHIRGDQWRPTKMTDKHAQPGNANVLGDHYHTSVKTGRTMEEIRIDKPWKKNQDDQLPLRDEN